MIIDFVGQSRQDSDNIGAAPPRLLNLYREVVGDRYVLKGVPGQTLFVDLDDILGRALGEVGGRLYAVSGGALYLIGSGGIANNIGAIADDEDTFIAGYSDNVLVSAGGNYYVYDGATISTVTGGAFSDIGSVAFVNGYAVLTERDGSRFQWSELQDPDNLNALYFATAEARDDVLLRAVEYGGNLYLFGANSTEIWTTGGGSGATAFGRLAGGVINRGIKAAGLIASFDDGMFFVGNDGICYIMAGAQMQPVSGRGVETAIADETPTRCFYYEEEGHKFLVLRFASRPAWVYDVSTGEWHERATGNNLEAWNLIGAAKAYGSWRGVNVNSQVVTLGGVNDLGETIIKRAVSGTAEGNEDRFRVGRVVVRARTGFQDLGRDMALLARFSGDRGVTWGAQKQRSLGDLGNYDGRAVWRSLGLYRTLTMELTLGDSVDAPIYSDVVVDVI
jgi:hypothetical protein